MAYVLSDIRTKVLQRIRDTGYAQSEADNYLNDTQNDVCNEYRFEFMKTGQNYTVTVGVADITNGSGLPATLDQVIDLVDTTLGGEKVIPYIEQTELDRLYPDNQDVTRYANNKPLYWYREGAAIKVFPAPAAAYTFRLKFYKMPTLLTTDSQVPELPSNFEEVLVEGAVYRILQVKDQYDQAAIHKNKYDELLQKLVVRRSQQQIGRPTIMGTNRHPVMHKSTLRWR